MNLNRFLFFTIKIFLLVALAVKSNAQEFVSIHVKGFINNGEPFYPIVCNFRVNFLDPPGGNDDYFTIPYREGGPTENIDCTSESGCLADIDDELEKVSSMGFNAIRLAGVKPIYREASDDFFIYVYQNYSSQYANGSSYLFVPPLAGNADLINYFNQLDQIVQLAKSHGLKVIMMMSDYAPPQTYWNDWQYIYSEFLGELASYFQNEDGVLAIDLFNEPCWQINLNDFPHKQFACESTELWYNTIKASAPDMLVTIGSCGLNEDLRDWDPGVLHVDFLSVHDYPGRPNGVNYNLEDEIARYAGRMKWHGENIPYAWIIGETGFTAEDDVVSPWNDIPYQNGTEEDQRQFAEGTLQSTFQCGGKGYSWWFYQNIFKDGIDLGLGGPELDDEWCDEYRGNFYGLLNYGNPTDLGIEKPVVQEFQTFDAGQVGGGCPTIGYEEPFAGLNYHIITGTVIGQNNNPIVGAWVEASYFAVINGFSLQQFVYDFTDVNGQFEIGSTIEDNIGKIQSLNIYYVGCSVVELATWLGNTIDSGITYSLDCLDYNYSGVVDSENVGTTEVEYFDGWSMLNVTNTIVDGNNTYGGEAIFTAQLEVILGEGFHAMCGSDVTIHLGDTFPDCSTVNTIDHD